MALQAITQPDKRTPQPSGPLAAMRIRKKLVVLHTIFSLGLGLVLLLCLRPAVHGVVERAHHREARDVLAVLEGEARELTTPRLTVRAGSAAELGVDPRTAGLALARRGEPVDGVSTIDGASAVAWISGEGEGASFLRVRVSDPDARSAVWRFYAVVVIALLGVYGLIAVALELLVLPRHVYGPIRSLLRADRAAREGDREGELIPSGMIPADELGAIMRSRNEVVRDLRLREEELAAALERLETVAADLRKKNHLLETARRNLEGADRLASLGMMSAGLAHELNTPLSVAKGLAETLANRPERSLSETEAALLGRVIGRLEKLSESLLDFARARPPATADAALRKVAEEACTLVRLDRVSVPAGSGIEIINEVPTSLVVPCDADRMVQVLVNLVRNAVDAMRAGGRRGRVALEAGGVEREGSAWVSLTVTDDGPGIEPDAMETLFEPFVSTKLDARGTGLGLAVADGIVREHGGVIVARNRPGRAGAVFEVLLPAESATLGRAEASEGT